MATVVQSLRDENGNTVHPRTTDNAVVMENGQTLREKMTSITSSSYVHVQAVANTIWEIVHNLGKYPSVTVVDSSGRVVIGEVVYVTNNAITITFSAPFSGSAYMN